MPSKEESPKPRAFPCKIGIDFWMKTHPKPEDPTKKQRRPSQVFYKYTDAHSDIDGWADPHLWIPYPFDLCYLKTDRKTRTGWWTGKDWDGVRLRSEEKVLYWKKCNEDMS